MRKFRALAWLLWLAPLPARAEAPAPTPVPSSCSDMLAEVKALFAAHDPELLTVDITHGDCPRETLYEAAYYQGFASYLLADYHGALADLELARSLTGPWDEQILYYIWKTEGELKDAKGRKRALREFADAFPRSARLAEMRAAGAAPWWEATAGTSLAFLAGDKNYQGTKSRSFFGGGWNQEKGGARFEEILDASGNYSLDSRRQYFSSLEAGLRWHFGGWSASASLGPAWSVYRLDTLSVDTAGRNLQGTRMERRWAWQQAVSASRVFERQGGWDWTASLDYSQESGAFAFFGGSWDMDRFRENDWLSLGFGGEYRYFAPESGCADAAGVEGSCEASRLVATDAAASLERFFGRQIAGAGVKARVEKAVDTSGYWRTMGTAFVEYGIRFGVRLKWINSVEAGGDRDDREGQPVFNVTSSLTARFD